MMFNLFISQIAKKKSFDKWKDVGKKYVLCHTDNQYFLYRSICQYKIDFMIFKRHEIK